MLESLNIRPSVVVRVRRGPVGSAVDEYLVQLARDGHSKSGIRRQDADDPTHFVLYEAYATAEAAAAHKESAHYLSWRATVAPMMMAQPRDGKPFRGVFPAG